MCIHKYYQYRAANVGCMVQFFYPAEYFAVNIDLLIVRFTLTRS